MEMEQLKKALRAQIEEYKTLAFELSVRWRVSQRLVHRNIKAQPRL